MNGARRRLLQRGLFLGCGAGGLLASMAACLSACGGGDAKVDFAARFDGSAAAPAADSKSHPAADAGVPRRPPLQRTVPPGAIDVRAAPYHARGDGLNDHTAGTDSGRELTHELRVCGNTIIGARRGVGLTGVSGAVVENNRISDREGSMVGHVEDDPRADDVTVRGNHFERCGSAGDVGFSVHHARRLLLQDNHFYDCGHGGPGAYALDFRAGTSDGVALAGNRFSSASGRTRVAIQRKLNHRWTPAHNRFVGNELEGLPNRFEWE